MSLKEILKQKLDSQAAIVQGAIDAARAMNEEEQKLYDDLEAEIKNLEKTIEAEDKLKEREKLNKTPVNEPIYAKPKNPNEKKWKGGIGEFLQAVAKASSPGGRMDNRLVYQNSASGLNESVSSEGGFMLENDFIQDMFDVMMSESQVANRIRMIPIGANTNRLRTLGIDETSRANGSRWGGVQAYWIAEAETVTKSKPKFREIDMALQKLLALCYVTDDLLQDATALEAIVKQAYADEMSFKIDDAIINGTGVGMPLGILNSDALVSVPKESNQAAGTIKYENILKMWSSVPARLRANAVWYINQEIEPQLYTMALNIGTGGAPVFLPSGGASSSQYSTLLNRPIVPIEQCSVLGKKGDIILADPTQYIGIDKKAPTADVSIHVRFLYDEQVFRFIYKFNGAPYRNKPITPYKGANALSPFVTLADR
ncbi:phage major capsid protein [Clostridium tyrobutyricum]|uniref:Phage major capsid protein, HK97 family n=3 Tax=Clostridium tyrobutyricum TaxID=1519 RepID=W6N7I0_CLOTY|nr:phage major capsid protein [Clostridium tyrobutyricum]AND85569.1 phage-related protein [Clostridium tyrobutyricum]ANP70099.1 capsid protein [Clostridium tyrobutyricum]QNB65540.1 phage major capsid protein [Clostridium tyrobutyricum]CDL92471.1 phage major capsid protein, HK97 family [Clostridium tyrobutyricum DIVETGP]